jgi:hypothetical protein
MTVSEPSDQPRCYSLACEAIAFPTISMADYEWEHFSWSSRTTNQRSLGRSNLNVSALGLGCMGLSHAYGQPVDRQSGIAAADVTLSPADLHEIEAVLSDVTIAGARYSENLQKLVGR